MGTAVIRSTELHYSAQHDRRPTLKCCLICSRYWNIVWDTAWIRGACMVVSHLYCWMAKQVSYQITWTMHADPVLTFCWVESLSASHTGIDYVYIQGRMEAPILASAWTSSTMDTSRFGQSFFLFLECNLFPRLKTLVHIFEGET